MSLNESVNQWRLQTDGGIPYKLVAGYPQGGGTQGDAEISEQIIIQATDLEAFFEESFPSEVPGPPGTSYTINTPRACPHRQYFYTDSIKFSAHDTSRPVDPWSVDESAPGRTYGDFLTLDIIYKPRKGAPQEGDNSGDEREFPEYELSSEGSGDFIMIPATEWLAEDNEEDKPKEVEFKIPQAIPTISWTARWSSISRDTASFILAQSRQVLGQVNNVVLSQIYNAPAETILFLGFNIQENYQFVWGEKQKTTLSLELSFVEKNVQIPIEAGVAQTITHNHIYRPSTGRWEKLQRPDGGLLYKLGNLSGLFWVPDQDQN